MIYCMVPRELAPKLHELLRRHYRDEAGVEVVVEQRDDDRRAHGERRAAGTRSLSGSEDRRQVRATEGRRVAERRAPVVPVDAPLLPRRARRYAEELVFLERLEPTTLQLEDIDTAGLVTRFQAGDHQAFSELYVRYFDRVYSYIRVALNDPHGAEDLTQQVFLNVLEALPSYERRSEIAFRRWLFVVVRNETLREVKKRGRSEPVDPAELGHERDRAPEPEAEPLVALEWLADRDLVMFVERLPLVQRQVIVLRYMLDMSYPEIAAVMGRSEVDVRSLHSRGVRFLRERLAALGRPQRVQRRVRMRSCTKQLPVIAARRWSLHS